MSGVRIGPCLVTGRPLEFRVPGIDEGPSRGIHPLEITSKPQSAAAHLPKAADWVGTADCVLVRAKSPDRAMARAYQDVIPPGPDQSYPTTKSKSLKLMADRKPPRVLSPTMFARPM